MDSGGELGPKYAQLRSHRVAWMLANRSTLAANREINADSVIVIHKCDAPACCNPDHLATGTQAENIQDAVAKGRAPQLSARGEGSKPRRKSA